MNRATQHRPELFTRPAIVLSASVPFLRTDEQLADAGETLAENRAYVRTARPDLIRDAVLELCRVAFARDITLIFGGHPAITPMVLAAARQFGRTARPMLVLFQSEWFQEVMTNEARGLANESYGTTIWSPVASTRRDSLRAMRDEMVTCLGVVATVCIGGMDGVLEEARVSDIHSIPTYPIAATGGGARRLFDENTDIATSYPWLSMTAFAVVVRRIFNQHPLLSGE